MNIVEIISSGLIVIFLVQQLKRWIPTDFLPIVAIVIGAIVQVLNDVLLATEPVTAATIWVSIITGIVVGMSASGAYDIVGRAGAKIPPATIELPQSDEANALAVIDPATLKLADLSYDELESLRARVAASERRDL